MPLMEEMKAHFMKLGWLEADANWQSSWTSNKTFEAHNSAFSRPGHGFCGRSSVVLAASRH